MSGDGDQSSKGLPMVNIDEDEIPRGSIGTGGGLQCPYCHSAARHEVKTKQGTVAFECDDCGTIYSGDGR